MTDHTSLKDRYNQAKRALFDRAYESLNERQRQAVFTVNGPLLVLAGAGSGKTTVLVRRIAFLIRYGNAYFDDSVPERLDEERVSALEQMVHSASVEEITGILPTFTVHPCEPYRVLAITFTNKAANEIKSRLASMFSDLPGVSDEIWAGTFHSVCMRILRVNGEKVGLRPGFSVYDADDSKKAFSEAMKRCNIDEKFLPVKSVQNTVSRAKDKLLTPDLFAKEAGIDFRLSQVAKVYAEYQSILRESNALDFDDIILETVRLFRENPDVLDVYQRKFKYVSVDEFQDTNVAQKVLTQLLAAPQNNLMAVGDDDQSIYRFRGATIENILSFDRDFQTASVIKLEQNYRSTQNILDAANAVISNNNGRRGKNLWTAQNGGAKLRLVTCEDQTDEAKTIVDAVVRAVSKQNRVYRDFAVLYRTNAQGQSIEKAFAKSGVPCRILGGVRFSDRQEIRDAVAYLQLVNNHDDNVRLRRIINQPRRKIGDKTLDAVAEIALEQNCSQFEILRTADRYPALSRSASLLRDFASLIEGLSDLSHSVSLDVLYDAVLDRSGYRQMWMDAGESEKERLDNLEEFKSGILEYMKESEKPTLTEFLEMTSLVADVDRYDETADAVVLMTVHSAKGLEFPVVFLPGMEEGLFPGMQTVMAGPEDMEEERRLCYVAITRAKEELYLLHTRVRLMYGRTSANPLSPFVREIPDRLLEKAESAGASSYGGYSFGRYSQSAKPRQRVYTFDREDDGDAGGSFSSFSSPSPFAPASKASSRDSSPGKKAAPAVPLFVPGDRVRHPSFGEGIILSVKSIGKDQLCEIVFDTVGTKKIMATYARMQKLS